MHISTDLAWALFLIVGFGNLMMVLRERAREKARVAETDALKAREHELQTWCDEKDAMLGEYREDFVEPVERLGRILISLGLRPSPEMQASAREALDEIERIAVSSVSPKFEIVDGKIEMVSDDLPDDPEEEEEEEEEESLKPKTVARTLYAVGPDPKVEAPRFRPVPEVVASAAISSTPGVEVVPVATLRPLSEVMSHLRGQQPALMPLPITLGSTTADGSPWSMVDSTLGLWAFSTGKPEATLEEMKAWFGTDPNERFLTASFNRLLAHDPEKVAPSSRTAAAMMVVHVSNRTPGFERLADVIKEAEAHLASVGV
jgi:hypothetical protein